MGKDLLVGSVKVIRKALTFKAIPVYASPMVGEVSQVKIVKVRSRMGSLEVQSQEGTWFSPNEDWRVR